MRWPIAAAVRLRRRPVSTPGGTVVVFVLSVFALLRVAARGQVVGTGFGVSMPLWARHTTDATHEDEEDRAMDERGDQAMDIGKMHGLVRGVEQISGAIERAASGEGAVGPPTSVGDATVIPLVETVAQGGFGLGSGSGTEGEASQGSGGGGGGGGLGRSRTVAVAIVGPDGVKIRPVVDVTGLALPAVSAVAALLLGRRRRRHRRH